MMQTTDPVGFGLLVPTLMEFEPCGIDRLREAARIGDQSDFDVLWVGDHLLFDSPILESTVSLAVLGTMTEHVKVGTNVLQLPLRRPIDVAKTFATISHLTQGRLILGVGVGGHFPTEWEAAGIDTRERGARCDEAIDMLGWLWEGKAAQGKFGMSPGLAVSPPPVGGRVPIWVGGRVDAAIRRAARCDGSLNMWVSPRRCTEIRERVIELRPQGTEGFTFGLELLAHVDNDVERARAHVRDCLSRLSLDPDAIEKYTAFGTPEMVAEKVSAYVDAGVQHISFYLPGVGWSEQAHRLAEEVLPLIRASHQSAAGATP
ncbi:LLM class flavin-dependent oxidoreductase [Streptomyces sp. NPDC001984]|uniref:LLM class flavin-dependent oxidoreductase n=1 Tax=Streptomyces sp. NPDC002619 TaxID=3364655 RepID=UPI0036B4FAB0